MSNNVTWSHVSPTAHFAGAFNGKLVMEIEGSGAAGIWLNYRLDGKDSLLFLPSDEAIEMANLILANVKAE